MTQIQDAKWRKIEDEILRGLLWYEDEDGNPEEAVEILVRLVETVNREIGFPVPAMRRRVKPIGELEEGE